MKKKEKDDEIDLCNKSIKANGLHFPDFYFLTLLNDWSCKTCWSFAQFSDKERAFVEIPEGFQDHPLERTKLDLE